MKRYIFAIFIAALITGALMALAGSALAAYDGQNGTVLRGPDIGDNLDNTRTWYFNATTPDNSTSITASLPFMEWCDQCKFWAQGNAAYNSSNHEQTWTTPASTARIVVGDAARNVSRNQTITGSIALAAPNATIVDGPAYSYTFVPSGLMDNRTVTVHGMCWR